MESKSQILEKSTAMTGECLDERTVWQGSPATMWFRYPEHDPDSDFRFGYTPPKEFVSGSDTSTTRSDIEMGTF
jgi:hypothetical protein